MPQAAGSSSWVEVGKGNQIVLSLRVCSRVGFHSPCMCEGGEEKVWMCECVPLFDLFFDFFLKVLTFVLTLAPRGVMTAVSVPLFYVI